VFIVTPLGADGLAEPKPSKKFVLNESGISERDCGERELRGGEQD
jgi:hypothetical protein